MLLTRVEKLTTVKPLTESEKMTVTFPLKKYYIFSVGPCFFFFFEEVGPCFCLAYIYAQKHTQTQRKVPETET